MAEAAELRALARVERDPRQRVRLLAIANVREGMPVEAAARATGMGRATLYRWLARERASRAWRADRRLLDAYQAEVISLEELIGPAAADQRRAQGQQLDQRRSLRQQRAEARAVLNDLTAFCTRVRGRLDEAPLADKQAICSSSPSSASSSTTPAWRSAASSRCAIRRRATRTRRAGWPIAFGSCRSWERLTGPSPNEACGGGRRRGRAGRDGCRPAASVPEVMDEPVQPTGNARPSDRTR